MTKSRDIYKLLNMVPGTQQVLKHYNLSLSPITCSYYDVLKNLNLNSNDISLHTYYYRMTKIQNADKEQQEFSFKAGGKGEWYSHFWEQFGDFL